MVDVDQTQMRKAMADDEKKDKVDEDYVFTTARKYYLNTLKDSHFHLPQDRLKDIPQFSLPELVEGKLLGTGTFITIVYSILSRRLRLLIMII